MFDAAPVVLYCGTSVVETVKIQHDLFRTKEHVVSKSMQDTVNNANANIFAHQEPCLYQTDHVDTSISQSRHSHLPQNRRYAHATWEFVPTHIM
jgi:hypothetical protein